MIIITEDIEILPVDKVEASAQILQKFGHKQPFPHIFSAASNVPSISSNIISTQKNFNDSHTRHKTR